MRLVAPSAFKGTRSPLEAARHLALPGDRLMSLSDVCIGGHFGCKGPDLERAAVLIDDFHFEAEGFTSVQIQGTAP